MERRVNLQSTGTERRKYDRKTGKPIRVLWPSKRSDGSSQLIYRSEEKQTQSIISPDRNGRCSFGNNAPILSCNRLNVNCAISSNERKMCAFVRPQKGRWDDARCINFFQPAIFIRSLTCPLRAIDVPLLLVTMTSVKVFYGTGRRVTLQIVGVGCSRFECIVAKDRRWISGYVNSFPKKTQIRWLSSAGVRVCKLNPLTSTYCSCYISSWFSLTLYLPFISEKNR